MNKTFKKLILLLSLFSLTSCFADVDTIKDIAYYFDKTNSLTIEQIKHKKFKKTKTTNLNLGHNKETLWLKFKIKSNDGGRYVIDYGKYLVDFLDVHYVIDNHVIKSYSTGNLRPKHTKAYDSPYFLFPIDLHPKLTYTIYFKIKSSKMHLIDLQVRKEKEILKKQNITIFISTVFYITLIITVLTNIIIYSINKRRILKYYIYYLLGSIIYWFTITGYTANYIITDSPTLNALVFYIGVLIYFHYFTKYTFVLINAKSHFKKTYNFVSIIINIILPASVLIRLFTINDCGYLAIILNRFMMLTIALLLALNIYLLIKSLSRKTFMPKAIIVIWLIKATLFFLFLLNFKLYLFDLNFLNNLILVFIIVETILLSALLGYFLNYSDMKVKRMKELYKKNKALQIQNYKQVGMENIFKSIMHQWKQPLNILNSIVIGIDTKVMKNELSNDYLQSQLNEIENQTEYMSDTLDTFAQYFNYSSKEEGFILYNTLIKVTNLLSPYFKTHNITYSIHCSNKDVLCKGNKKEYIQILIILITNASEAFIRKNIKKRELNFYIYKDKNNNPAFAMKDSAGGVEKELEDKLFKANTSSKSESNSGLGLFIAKTIADNMNKTIEYKKIRKGSKFIIQENT